MKNYFFSVIVLGYNIENYIEECLNSVLAQKYANFEVLVIDDGSTDKTSLICKEYEKKDPRVHYYFQTNAGTTAARIKGFSLSKGDYVIAVDGDDTVNENWLSILNENLQNKEYDCLFYNYYNWENGQYLPSNLKFSQHGDTDPILTIKETIETRNHPLWNKAFKRELVLLCNNKAALLPKLSMNNDTIHVFYILANMKTACVINEYLINYRILPKSASHGYKFGNIRDAILSIEYAFDALKDDLENFEEYKKLLIISLLRMISFRLPMMYFSNKNKKEKKNEIKNIRSNEIYKVSKEYEKLRYVNFKEFIFLKIFRMKVPFLYFILRGINKFLRIFR